MLIWKTIDASPGITRDEIFEKIEHEIPPGWAKRRYAVEIGRSENVESLPIMNARRYILTHTLRMMRSKHLSIICDDAGGYRTLREIKMYRGNRDHVDETGTKAADHINAAYALPVVEKFVARTEELGPRGKSRPTAKEWDAIKQVARAYRAV
jgi:hypothetical protein